MNVLIKSAKIIDASNKDLHLQRRDISIINGKIDRIAVAIEPQAKTRVIELKNLHVSVGWFDSGACFGEPGHEERETIANGLHCAAKSGYTDVVLNPGSYPVPDSSSDIVFLKNAARGQATDLYPLGTLTAKGEGVHLAELYDMKNSGAVGFYDFKHSVQNPNLLKIALQYAQNFEGLVYSFPQDVQIAGKGVVNEGNVSTALGLKGIPALAEELQLARDIFVLEYTGGKLHIPTISTAGSVKLVAEAKKKKLNISCSVSIHNLFFTDVVLEGFDSRYKVMPPLRTKADAKALLKGLQDGVIDFVTADHIPMNIEQKQVEFDNAAYGTIGMESAFGALNQLLGTEPTVALLTKGRSYYGIETPVIRENATARLTLFDPDTEYVFGESDIRSLSRNSMFIGSSLKGKAYGIINNGQVLL